MIFHFNATAILKGVITCAPTVLYIAYSDCRSCFVNLLTVLMLAKNLKIITTEMFKIKKLICNFREVIIMISEIHMNSQF